MNATVRAKIKIQNVKSNESGAKEYESILAGAVYSDDKESENYSFSVATPSLSLSMHINNPSAFDRLIEGKEYYLDFIPVE